jgi:periplasmic mercuric ion binding protein
MKTPFLVILFALLTVSIAFSQPATKVGKACIKTSANCGECKVRIESGLKKVKGVKGATLNLETHEVCVAYTRKKTDPDKLRKAISMIGYDADDVPANQEAHDNLPMCCRKGGHD